MGPGWKIALASLAALSIAAPAAAQTLVVGARSEFVIDPHFMFVGPNMAAARYVFDTLVDRDVDARPSPGLAQSWKLLDDETWELKLRPGVVFQDGTPFTAADVAFSIARIPTLPNNPGPYTPNLRSIAKTEVVDPLTIRFHTDSPDPVIPGQMTNIFIVSAKAAAGATSADFASGKAAIGTGPFKLEKFVRGEGMELERNDHFWGKPSPWQHITVRVMTNDGARIAALLAGDVDLIEDVPPEQIETLQKSGKANVFARSSDRVMYLLPNVGAEKLALLTDADGNPLDKNPLRDPRVRHAISKAIDRKALIDRVLYGQGIAASQIVPESFGGYNPDLKVEAYDPAGAKQLLAEAGYPRGFGLTIGCTNDRYVNDARICQALGQMLSRAGIADEGTDLAGRGVLSHDQERHQPAAHRALRLLQRVDPGRDPCAVPGAAQQRSQAWLRRQQPRRLPRRRPRQADRRRGLRPRRQPRGQAQGGDGHGHRARRRHPALQPDDHRRGPQGHRLHAADGRAAGRNLRAAGEVRTDRPMCVLRLGRYAVGSG